MLPVVEHKIAGKKSEQKEIWQKCFECFKSKAKALHVHYVIIFVYVLNVEEKTLITHLTQNQKNNNKNLKVSTKLR